ncbi:MAG: 2-hydroxyacid dehydrogenase [Bauldia sp.]
MSSPAAPIDVLVCVGVFAPHLDARLAKHFNVLRAANAAERDAHIEKHAASIRAVARASTAIDRALIARLPKVEIISNYGVGYDMVDAKAAAERGIVVTNTPDVLTEEVADTALGLLLMTVRRLSAAERYLRDGTWATGIEFPPSPGTLRNRVVGIVGLGRIGLAIARRIAACDVKVAYHSRRPVADAPYPYFDSLIGLARNVDTLIAILPASKETDRVINAEVIGALGPEGVVINIGRGNAVDESALIDALSTRRILAAGLDVYWNEPHIDRRFLALDNVVLLPHVGSASVATRTAMEALVEDNLVSWFRTGRPVTPVVETPWPRP